LNTLNALKRLAIAVAAVSLVITFGVARANMLATTVVTGTVEQVSAVAGQESITVNGTVYAVQDGTPAATALASVKVGDYVDLQVSITGNPSVPGMVVNIGPHANAVQQ